MEFYDIHSHILARVTAAMGSIMATTANTESTDT